MVNEDDPNAWETKINRADRVVATVRTALPTAWTVGVLWAVEEVFDFDIPSEREYLLIPIVGGAVAVAYNIFREIEARWPVVGRIFTGIVKKPTYDG